MNDSAVRPGATRRSWRMRQWPNDPTVAHLVFVDHHDVPSIDLLDTAVAHARCRDARAVRTSALFPAAAKVVLGAGFEVIDRLVLLRRSLTAVHDLPATGGTRPMMPWHHRAAARIDQAAFGPLWGNDADSLRDIRHATPGHRARVIRLAGDLAGFAVSGAAGDHGYLQRLAVDPARRRRGLATDLVVDTLDWMHRRGLRSVLVNTGETNTAALALYTSLGFETLGDELVIAELRLV